MVITVGRQYGSGGREIGTMLAKQLGIAITTTCCSRRRQRRADFAKSCSVPLTTPEELSLFHRDDPYSFSMNHVTPKGSIEQQVYLATYDTIKKLADKGPAS